VDSLARQSDWQVHPPEVPEYNFFLSHVREDKPDVIRLKSEISSLSGRQGRNPLKSFLDTHDWTQIRNNTQVIRESLRVSEFFLAWITPDYIGNNRGWVWLEWAYAELLELSQNHHRFEVELPFIIPVFVGVRLAGLERSPILRYWERGIRIEASGDSVKAIAKKIVEFHADEQRRRSGTTPPGKTANRKPRRGTD